MKRNALIHRYGFSNLLIAAGIPTVETRGRLILIHLPGGKQSLRLAPEEAARLSAALATAARPS